MLLEDRIRELCAKALAAPKGELRAWGTQTALHEHTEYLRQLATKALVGEGRCDRRTMAL